MWIILHVEKILKFEILDLLVRKFQTFDSLLVARELQTIFTSEEIFVNSVNRRLSIKFPHLCLWPLMQYWFLFRKRVQKYFSLFLFKDQMFLPPSFKHLYMYIFLASWTFCWCHWWLCWWWWWHILMSDCWNSQTLGSSRCHPNRIWLMLRGTIRSSDFIQNILLNIKGQIRALNICLNFDILY